MNRPPFYARHGLLIVVLFALSVPFVVRDAQLALRENRNKVEEWLPDVYAETRAFNWFRRHFEGEQFVLLSWEGCTLDDPRLEQFALALEPAKRSEPASGDNDSADLFLSVTTGPRLIAEMVGTLAGRDAGELDEAQLEAYRRQAIHRLEGLFVGPDGQQSCVVVALSDLGEEQPRRAMNVIRDRATVACGIPADELHLGGPPVDNVTLDEAGEASLQRLAAVSVLIGLLISWWCLRRPQLVLMVCFCGLYAGAVSLAMVWWAGQTTNAILLTMPSLVYVAATSGAIHLTNYFRDTAVRHGLEGAPERAVRHALLPLSLATGTTAVGLLSLCISELAPIRGFGYFSAIGVVATLIPLLLFLPAALAIWPPRIRKEAESIGGRWTWKNPVESLPWARAGEAVIRRRGAVMLGGFLLLAVCAWGLNFTQTSVHMMRFFAHGSRIRADYAWLESRLGPLVPLEIVLRLDDRKCQLTMLQRMELVGRIQSQIDEAPHVGNSLSAVTFAPDLPGGSGWSLRRSVMNKQLIRNREAFIEGGYLAEVEGEELWRISARVPALDDRLDYGDLLVELQGRIDPLLEAERARGVSGLAPATYTGLVPLIYKAQHSLLDGLVWGFVGDWLLIAVVMMIVVRDWSAGLVLMLPSMFPAIVVFGLMGWMGVVIDVGTVMTPAVALGVTVDDVVHYMLWYRNGLSQGQDRRQSIMLAYRGCAQAMYQSWGVIGLGLAVFALSPFMPTQRFGYMMIALLTASLVGNLLFLPAILASPLGNVFTRRTLRRRERTLAREALDAPRPRAERRSTRSAQSAARS
jgi:predicted RND superfamily exporter protein